MRLNSINKYIKITDKINPDGCSKKDLKKLEQRVF